jgi:hypothetical protein
MNEKRPNAVYISQVCRCDIEPSALVIYCSYHRYQRQIQDFVVNYIGIESFDGYSVPGGAQFLVASGVNYKFKMADTERIKFLVNSHGIKKIICISDANCGWYKHLLGERTSPEDFKKRQVADLKKELEELKNIFPEARVQLFYVYPNEDSHAVFEEVK